jgi:hypothetical protein
VPDKKFCSACGAATKTKFCSGCGANVPGKYVKPDQPTADSGPKKFEPKNKFCMGCGHPTQIGKKFCMECGIEHEAK